jgi:hypothetical protein
MLGEARTPRPARIWLMETRLTHLLAFYRSEHVNQNWLATLTVIVDVAAFIKAAMPDKAPSNPTPARIMRIV